MKRLMLTVAALVFGAVFASVLYAQSTAPGTYYSKLNDKEYLTLNADGTFVLKQQSEPYNPDHPYLQYSGRYSVAGSDLTLTLNNGGEAKGKLEGNVFTDSIGKSWVKDGGSQDQPKKQMEVRPTRKKGF